MWIQDLWHVSLNDILPQFILLLRAIRAAHIVFEEGTPDEIKWTAGGGRTTRRARLTTCNSPTDPHQTLIWRAWASGKMKMFCWLLHHNRLWCNDRLQRQGWENRYFCALCNRNLESSFHLFWECLSPRQSGPRRRHGRGVALCGLTRACRGARPRRSSRASWLEQRRGHIRGCGPF